MSAKLSDVVPWPVATVGDYFQIQLGKMLDSARNVGELKPYLGNRAIRWGRIDISALGEVPLTPRDRSKYILKRNDLLVCEGGEVGRAAIWKEELPECYYQKALHRLRSRSHYDPRVMLALLEYWSTSNGFADYITQTSIAHLPREKFLMMPLPVIPQDEQERIGVIIDDTNGLVITLECLIAKKQAIKQGMMQQLLTGKVRLPGFPGVWTTHAFTQVLRSVNSRNSRVDASDYENSGSIPVVDQGKSYVCGYVDGTYDPLKPGSDGLIVFGDHTCVIKFVDFDFVVGADGTKVLEARSGFDARFITYLLELDPIEPTGYNRHFSFLKERHFYAPGINEQIAIARMIADVDREIELLCARLAKAKKIKQGMMQELLTGRTRLTPWEGPK